MPNFKLSRGKTGCFAVFCLLLITIATSAQTPSNDAYQNQQRARRLLQMDAEIKALPDVEIRCQLRVNILTFVYSNDARSEYAAAEPVLIALFEEMAANEKLLNNRPKYWRNSIALLLRKRAPETAKKIEAKYIKEVDTSMEDYQDLRTKGSADELADLGIARLRPDDHAIFPIIYGDVRQKDLRAAQRMSSAALDLGEKYPGAQQVALLYRIFDAVTVLNGPPAPQSPEAMLRYYRCVVAGARTEIGKPEPNAYVVTVLPLRRAMQKIKQADPALYAEAQAILAQYYKTLSITTLAKQEADDRIEASSDKLETAIAEAEAAKSSLVRDYLWTRASQMAIQKRYYRKAVDLLMKASPDMSILSTPKRRDEYILAMVVRDAMQKQDWDSATYAISNIKDDVERAKAMMEVGSNWGRLDKDPLNPSGALVAEGLDLIEKATPDPYCICQVAEAVRSLSFPTLKTREGYPAQTERAVRIVNRIPTTAADAKAGTPERAEFVRKTLFGALGCITMLFRPLMDSAPRPDAALANQINVKEWRLAANITIEMARKYPMPQTAPPNSTF